MRGRIPMHREGVVASSFHLGRNQDDAGTHAKGGAAVPFGNEAKAQNVPIKAAHRFGLSRFVIDGGF
jgi:hypothetical protein